MLEGWIKLYRNIQEHWVWQDPQKLKWWLDILLLANHKDNKFLLGNQLIVVKRGEHHTSELKLAQRWGVSKTTVRKFLKLLEDDHMIELKKSKKGTTLKISNYNDYQAISEGEKTIKKPQKNHNVDHKKTIKEPYAIPQKNHKVYTNKNEKNEKNENNDKNEKERKEIEQIKTPSFPTSFHEKVFNYFEEVTYKTWFANCEAVEDKEEIQVIATSKFMRDIITQKYKKTLETLTGKKIIVKE